jgi:hypothetical protein
MPIGTALPVTPSLSRRELLGGAALALGFAAAGSAAAAETPEAEKIKQADAHYQNRPQGQQRCAICLQFEPPSSCRIVAGPIVPTGWCQFFAARENAR